MSLRIMRGSRAGTQLDYYLFDFGPYSKGPFVICSNGGQLTQENKKKTSLHPFVQSKKATEIALDLARSNYYYNWCIVRSRVACLTM